ncbi:MAG TPA: hypothetical protein VK465_17025 [Fibrobacteria bacterium]|nr:hypothetical protein [Fibrobacteria bacterium]
MFANVFIRNRPFHGKMRNLNYRRCQEAFQRIHDFSRQETLQPKEMVRLLDEYIVQLKVTFQYASDAIRGLKRRKIGMYRVDKVFGVLEEEIVFCYFLEEMISNSEFVRKRLETDLKIRIYRERIKRFQGQSPGGSGFLANILDSLDAMNQTEFIAIERLIDIMDERYRIGNKLFDIILGKSTKPPAPVPGAVG